MDPRTPGWQYCGIQRRKTMPDQITTADLDHLEALWHKASSTEPSLSESMKAFDEWTNELRHAAPALIAALRQGAEIVSKARELEKENAKLKEGRMGTTCEAYILGLEARNKRLHDLFRRLIETDDANEYLYMQDEESLYRASNSLRFLIAEARKEIKK